MKKGFELDYNQYYRKVLANEEDLDKIKASDFINYFAELIIKYSLQLEEKINSERGELYH